MNKDQRSHYCFSRILIRLVATFLLSACNTKSRDEMEDSLTPRLRKVHGMQGNSIVSTMPKGMQFINAPKLSPSPLIVTLEAVNQGFLYPSDYIKVSTNKKKGKTKAYFVALTVTNKGKKALHLTDLQLGMYSQRPQGK